METEKQKASSERHESSSPEGSDGTDQEAVEMMVTARAKRATAGNRLSSLINKETKDDIDLLFAEDEGEEEDMEFEEDEEDASDAELVTSSDDEDQGSAKDGEEDLAGEKELQKQDRLDKKKRKAQDMLKRPGALRKRVKIDSPEEPLSTSQPSLNPRPKKKSERVSWVPTAADAPTRISSRKQTVKNREVVHKRLVDSEKQRIKIMKQMEAAQKRKDASKAKPMTQAERMEEAAKMERKNAKSLNRWEEAEKKRAEEQKAKLEALHNRQLNGPVVSFWSGIARWINGKVSQNGVREIRETGHKEHSVFAARERIALAKHPQNNDSGYGANQNTTMSNVGQTERAIEPATIVNENAPESAKPSEQTASAERSYGLLNGIHAYANLPVQVKQPEFTGTADDGQPAAQKTASPTDRTGHQSNPKTLPHSTALVDEYASRNLVALRNIDANASKGPELHDNPLLKKQKIKLQKPAPAFCSITALPARFRDPKTGLPYANSYAYKEVQRLYDGGSRWSNLLGCYAGSATIVARGVPERFFRA